MFEGLVQKLLLDYLGRYVKDIQKEQLKIGLWNGEVLMENVELVIEAFDYLQLPFALKQGRVGRLSIKIPWKKLGWDPIIIVLEDVFICASQRDDHEWSSDSVKRREFAGKKAKLAAAELAKLSRRVCDSQGGQSFISYITAKILDGIQVSIRNVHVIYSDKQSDSAQFVFGLRFSSLTIMKQNPIGSSNGKFRGGQVNKIVEISHLGIYCSTYQGTLHLMGIENVDDYQSCSDARLESDIFDYMLAPFDVAISLVVNRSGKLENGVPQYLIIAELTALVMLLNEIQMQQILILWDYLTTCQLREKYGRYRPGCNSLSRKLKGWQRMWWHYAQESVLSDIRRKLRKSSWRYLGWRISYRRKYVSLYKTKLDFLRQEQPVDNDILRELEQMEKESDLDDILSYRSIAERESQELLLSSKSTNVGTNGGHISVEKQQNDDRLSFKSRGWLNWLSLGMLGAGGTEDSIQFSGAVSDEIVQDIYEATKFHPVPSLDRGASARNRIHLSSIKFNIHQITAALQSKTYNKETVRVNFDEVIIECNFWEDSWSILSLVNSVEMVDPYTKKVILLTKKAFTEENLLKNEQPSITVQVDMAPTNYDCELSLKVVLQPFEVTYDSQFLLNLLDFHHILGCFQFQYERVLTSLNGFEDVNARLLSKAEYILSNHTRIFWDISFSNIIIKVPWETEDSKSFIMVLELGSLLFRSMVKAESPASENADRHNSLFTNFVCLTSINDTSLGVQLPDLYDHFEIVLTDIEVNLMVPNCSQAVSILERFSASITLASCIIVDESMLKQWEVHFSVSSLSIHFSESIYGAAVGLIAILEDPNSKSEPVIQGKTRGSSSYWFSIAANLKSVRFHVKLADDAENSLVLIFALGDLDIQYAFQEFMEYWVGIKILEISTCTSGGETNSHVLCSPRNMSAVNSSHQHDMGVGIGIPSNDCGERIASAGGCFLLHYQDRRSVGIVYHKYTVCLNDVDIHLYPNIFGSLLKFYDRLSGYGTSSAASNGKNSSDPSKEINESVLKSCFDLQKFGFSNFYEAGSTPLASIPLNHFPFVTIQNSGSLSSLEQSLIHGICEWRRILDVRDKKFVRSPKFNLRKRSRMFNYPAMRPPSNIDISPPSGSCYDVDLFVIDLNLNGIRAHFHDSSCILGTLTLPITKSLLTVHGTEYLDLLFSVEGLLLSSSWSTWDFHEFLWGYSVPDLSPILNFRLRKENRGALNPQIEFSVSIQHVCCVLSPEFLSILIGYFSLPDWNSNGNEQLVAGSHKYEDTENDNYDIIHKFEILDSTLILPVESCNNHSLHLELRQLYCSFKPANHSEGALKDIPPECTVPSYKVVDTVHLVNVFGRDLSLSLVLLKEEGEVSVKLDQDTRRRNISLIAPLDADLWIRIPCESKPFCAPRTPTCIMMRIHNCQVIAEDDFFFCGVEAVLNAINQLLSIGRESECFTSDVLHFLQLKRSLKDGNLVVPNVSSITLTEVRFCVNSLSINLYRSRRRHAVSSELIAKADMKLTSSALFRNEIPLCLDVDFSGLALHSFHTSVTLLKCTSEGSISSGLVIHLSESDQGESELLVGLPSLHVWLHLLDWTEFIDLLGTFVRQLAKTSFMNASSENSNPDPVEQTRNVSVSVCENDPESPMLSCSTLSQNSMQDSVQLIVKSENISVSFHFPVLVKQQVFDEWREAEVQEENPWDFSSDVLGERTMLKAKHCKYIAIGLHSRDTELVICGQHAKLKSNVEKIRGMLETIEDQRVLSWPFFQLVQVNLLAEICDKQQEKHATTEIRIESLDVWLSYQILYFWHDVGFKIPEAGSSQFSFNSLVVDVQLMKASLLLTDGRWSCNGPLLEILLKNSHLYASITESTMDSSVAADLLVNYNNINKVMWEPFIEPWSFQLNMITKNKQSALQNTSAVTDVQLKSEAQLNLNVTEPLIEVIFRGNELIKDVWDQVGLNDLPESQRFLGCQTTDNAYTRRYAPYILQNETSLPLLFQVYHGVVNADDLDTMVMTEGNIVQPGSSLPIYLDETPEDQVFRYRSSQSSDKLNEKKSNGVVHHMISIQLDGTSRPSIPISMDVVGLSYFEVDFSKSSEKIEVEKNEDASKYNKKIEEKCRTDPNSAYVVPVVFDVSIQRYSKLIRLYSTVILLNATSIPLELRFDIPFGVSPKVLDPIFPGQEFPLPLHLAEAGRMRWRPLGNSFLWSEAHLLSNVLSQGNRLGFLRSFVCYPSHTSSDPFRCCISVQHISLPSFGGPKKGSSHHIKETVRHSVENSDQKVHNLQQSKRSIHYVTLTTPLLVKNYLPREVSLKIESAGITRSVLLSEVNNASIFHIDSTHDLEIGFHVHGFKACIAKFPRAETFITVARFLKTTYSLSETLAFYPELSGGPIYVTVEKVMDAFCGAREFCISVPFLLYNCSGLPLTIADSGNQIIGDGCTIPSCYHLTGEDQLLPRKHGLGLLFSKQDSYATPKNIDDTRNSFSKNYTIFQENANLHAHRFLSRHLIAKDTSARCLENSDKHNLYTRQASLNNLENTVSTSSQYEWPEEGENGSDLVDNECRKVEAFMYSPHPSSSASEIMVKLSTCLPECVTENNKGFVWSSPFFLVPASGSTSVVVPRTFTSGAFILSVTSSQLAGPFSGRTRAITFQPRYVISNACSKDLCYKQKGTDSVFHLGIGQHSHLHWVDTTRELLVSLRFSEPGWLWSGSFFPDHLGDTQVKMRNYVCGALNMIRVEVQNADVSIRDKKIVSSPHGNSGTHLILLSDDNTGFMPYRIDNFSKERLRIYQQKCENFETTVHSYTSCPYAWDEPCYPHRLVVELPGERVLGSYTLDDVNEQIPVYLPSTSEKPGRRLFLYIRAEGAVKVLSVIDSSYHLFKDMSETGFPGFKEKKKLDHKQETFLDYSERISVHISFFGISLIDSYPQELLYASANGINIDVLQSVERQRFSFQISSLQIDNQLRNATYPVILSFDHEYGGNSAGQIINKDDSLKIKNRTVRHISSDSSCEPIFWLAASKWRNKEVSLVSFEYINLRLAALRVELEEEIILSFFNFVRTVISRLQSRTLPCLDSSLRPLAFSTVSLKECSAHYESVNINRGEHYSRNGSKFPQICSSPSLPSVLPIGAPWQKIYLLARRQKKIYVEIFDLAPIKLTLSFSSAPWMLRNEGIASAESLGHISGTSFQRGLMALADVEGAPVYLRQLAIAHHMGSWESFEEILIRHYTRQLLHEMYKVFGSAGVIGNPMGFARNLGLGIKDFLSVPAKGILQSPAGLITGMAQGTTSLLSNTVYAISNATTQFSKSAQKSIVAFTFDDQAVSKMEKQQKGLASHSKGVLNEFLEGLTGFLQSPIRGAEKHGLPGVLSGIALGTAGLVARPVVSILEVTGKTAQSIRNRSSLHRPCRFQVRFPRPLDRELPLRTYSWEEAIGTSMLLEADDNKLKDEIFVMCKALKQSGKFVIITKRLVLVFMCLSLVGFSTPEFRFVSDPEWVIEVEISLESVIHVDREEEVLNIVGTSPENILKQHQHKGGSSRTKRWSHSTMLPLFQTSMEFASKEDAEDVLVILLSTIEQGTERGSGMHVLHQSNLRLNT